jgi:hypothetical protein
MAPYRSSMFCFGSGVVVELCLDDGLDELRVDWVPTGDVLSKPFYFRVRSILKGGF